MAGVGYIFTTSRLVATFCHAFCMAASNYRVVCNLHAIMVYNAEAPLNSLSGHPGRFQPSLARLYPLPLCTRWPREIRNVYTFHRTALLSRRLITPAWTPVHVNLPTSMGKDTTNIFEIVRRLCRMFANVLIRCEHVSTYTLIAL